MDPTAEFAELMNRAHVGNKASRNVLNDVNNNNNRKAAELQEQLELGKFINLIANNNA